jgi:hypothetical protein
MVKHHFAELTQKYQDLEKIPNHVEHEREVIQVNVKEFTKGDAGQQPLPFGMR